MRGDSGAAAVEFGDAAAGADVWTKLLGGDGCEGGGCPTRQGPGVIQPLALPTGPWAHPLCTHPQHLTSPW